MHQSARGVDSVVLHLSQDQVEQHAADTGAAVVGAPSARAVEMRWMVDQRAARWPFSMRLSCGLRHTVVLSVVVRDPVLRGENAIERPLGTARSQRTRNDSNIQPSDP